MSTDNILDLDELLGADDVRTEYVPTPAWKKANGSGGGVTIQSLSKWQERDCRERSMVTNEQGVSYFDDHLFDLQLLVEGVVEPKLTAEHVGALKAKSSAQVNAVVRAIMRLNRLEEGAVEEAQKTFPTGPGDAVPDAAGEDGGGAEPDPADASDND